MADQSQAVDFRTKALEIADKLTYHVEIKGPQGGTVEYAKAKAKLIRELYRILTTGSESELDPEMPPASGVISLNGGTY